MISLLERFYDPSGGRILFDGVDITQVEAKSYRENLSLVAQESTLYEGLNPCHRNIPLDYTNTLQEQLKRMFHFRLKSPWRQMKLLPKHVKLLKFMSS
jgi:ABC-type multidrug transport system fused ATPase/permease subunit